MNSEELKAVPLVATIEMSLFGHTLLCLSVIMIGIPGGGRFRNPSRRACLKDEAFKAP